MDGLAGLLYLYGGAGGVLILDVAAERSDGGRESMNVEGTGPDSRFEVRTKVDGARLLDVLQTADSSPCELLPACASCAAALSAD